MRKFIEFNQTVARAINHTTWNIPRIRDEDKWRDIRSSHLVENPDRVNGHDYFENAIFRVKEIVESCGWNTAITSEKERCHEYLYYQHYRLKCWK